MCYIQIYNQSVQTGEGWKEKYGNRNTRQPKAAAVCINLKLNRLQVLPGKDGSPSNESKLFSQMTEQFQKVPFTQ